MKKGLNIFEWILLKFRDVYTLPFITHQTFNIFWIEINERSFVYITIYKYVLYILNNDKWIFIDKKKRKKNKNESRKTEYMYISDKNK